ncbi:hypothetical protein BN3658_01182 [Coriobacteriaceae bacterium CHKCI002]|nr:hypothetical protein BN3658_01182 [Coriobacteriaceae bacterium CHKCI002]
MARDDFRALAALDEAAKQLYLKSSLNTMAIRT